MSKLFKDYQDDFNKREQRIKEVTENNEKNNAPNPVYIGTGQVRVLAINPTEDQLKEIIGDVAERFDTTYKTTQDQYNDNLPSRPIAVWITDVDSKVSPTLINFRLVDTPRKSKDGKPQYWNMMKGVSPNGEWATLSTLWSNDFTEGDVQEKTSKVGNAYTNNVLRPVRVGEENYYRFLKALLAWPNDETFMEAMEKVGLDFDTVYAGDFSALHALVNEELVSKIGEGENEQTIYQTFLGVFTAKVKEDGKVRQSFCMNPDTWFTNDYGVMTKRNLDRIKDLRKRRLERDGMDIIKDQYTLERLTEYDEDLVNKEIPAEADDVDEWI